MFLKKLFFKRKKENIHSQPNEDMDLEWNGNLPGEEYDNQNAVILTGAAMAVGTREYQEDAYDVRWLRNSAVVAMVCDGMGGLEGGDVASKKAIESVMRGINDIEENEWTTADLLKIAGNANVDIRDIEDDDENPLSCGTTMTLAVIIGNSLKWMSIGDSCIFLLTEGKLKRLTNEHNYSFMSRMLKDNDDFTPNPQVRSDALVSYLGAPVLKYIDCNTDPLLLSNGDMVMLCSDGVTKLLSDDDIEEILLDDTCEPEGDLDSKAQEIVAAVSARAAETQDNTTVVLLKCEE